MVKVEAVEDVFSVGAFRRRVVERLSADPAPAASDGGDHVLDALVPDPALVSRARLAAVLVPVVMREPEPTVLLTRRTDTLRDHSGQIAFPGGKVDPDDASPTAAALREAAEEIGLARCHIEPLAYLDSYLTVTNFRILPVVALVAPPFELTINAQEVDCVFEVPLRFLMQAANHQRHERQWRGQLRRYFAMPYGEHYIWGATAGILRNMYERLYA